MHLENDLAIRRQTRDILSDDVALGVGDGWHHLASQALVEIQTATGGKVSGRHVKQRSGKLSIFTDVSIRAVSAAAMQRVFDIANTAAEESAYTCEMCGGHGRLIAVGRLRVRCTACEDDEPARQRVWQEYKANIRDAAAYYVRVCLEHSRLLPVKNIVFRVCLDDRGHRLFLDEVHDRLTWWRAGSWIDGVDEALRTEFRRFDFGRR